MAKRGRKVRHLDKFILQRLNQSTDDGFTALEKIIDNLIDRAQRTGDVKLIELLLNRAYGTAKVNGEIQHSHNHTHRSVPPINWADPSQLKFDFELDDDEKRAIGK